MARPAMTKRGAKNLNRLTYGETSMLLIGFDFFDDVDMKTLPGKWEMYRDILMELWDSHEDFRIGNFKCNENKPGTLPWGHVVYDLKQEFSYED